MKKLIASIMATLLLSGCFGVRIDKGELGYSMNRLLMGSSKLVMPEIKNLPPYKDVDHLFRREYVLVWQTDTLLLVVTYDELTYQQEKLKLDKTFYFLSDSNFYVKEGYLPETEFVVGDFSFRILCDEQGYGNYPHDFGMIAVSDQRNSIAYLYLYNVNLDSVGDSFSDFIREYYPYQW